MARPKKNNSVVSSKDTKKEVVKEEKIETPVQAEEVEIPETKVVEVKAEEEIIPDPPAQIAEEKIPEESVEIPVVDSSVQFVEEPIVDRDNFKKVEVISDEEKKFHMNVSEIIVRLKKEPQYKFLSKVALIKIATDIVNKKYYSK